MPASGGRPVTTFHTVWYKHPAVRYQPGRPSAAARTSTSASVWLRRSAACNRTSCSSTGRRPGRILHVYQPGPLLGPGVARSLGQPRELIVLPGVAVCLCALLLQLTAQRGARTPESRAFNFGGPSFYLVAHAHRSDGVLFMDSFYRKAELGYPDEFRKTSDLALAIPPAATASY